MLTKQLLAYIAFCPVAFHSSVFLLSAFPQLPQLLKSAKLAMVLLMLLISTVFVFIESLINHENLPLFHTFICISSRSFNIAICCCIWKIARSHNSSIRYLLLGDCKDFLILRILYFWFTASSLFLSVHLCPSRLPFVSVSHHSNSLMTVRLIFIMPTIII